MEFFRPTCSIEEIKVDDVSMSQQSCSTDMHVLAVDDSHVDRKVIERLLKISSCKVTVVESGTRALQYLGLDEDKKSMEFNGLKVNLIMTDYSMPGMTGYELLKKIKESSAFREVPVVVMSSEKILGRINRCLEEGAEEFLLKPVKLADVKRLKDYIMRGVDVNEGKSINKRMRQDIDNTESSSTTTTSTLQSPACDSVSSDLDTQSSSQSSATSTIKRPRL